MDCSEAGKLGGNKRAAECDYAEMGRKGGNTTARKYGPDFYSAIGRKGAEKRRELMEKGKAVNDTKRANC